MLIFANYHLQTRYGNMSTGVDPNKENMIRFERYRTGDIKGTNLKTRNFFEKSFAARVLLCGTALFGVSLILSDGVLTPAQSVLGAIQGLTVVNPNLTNGAIVGITSAILVFLFAIQPLGVERISVVFAPIIIIWLLFNFSFGIYNLAMYDHSVLKAFSPYFAGLYFVRNKTEGWKSLGGILLCFTGVEALFADLGAFSKRAIQISALGFTFPCLLLAYIGQAARISVNPEAYSNPFFQSVPPGMFWPSQIVAILAAIVASQALITSAFQLLFQLVNMSYFPPVKIVYTSVKYHSQIYCPFANWLMMVGTIVVTAVFRDVSLVLSMLNKYTNPIRPPN
jgi:KUP system potassium uptake protein